MQRRRFLGAAGSVALASLAGCFGVGAGQSDAPPTDAPFDVGMSTRRFQPATIEIAPGETVVWKNTSSHAHTVTAYEDGIPDEAAYFASGGYDTQKAAESGWVGGAGGALYSGDVYEHTFEVPGTYNYFCIPHEQSGMTGQVVVTE